jgi:Tfp pilus assembly protein FimT
MTFSINRSPRVGTRRGMTLIELLLVIVTTSLILAILAPRMSVVATSASVQSAAFDMANRIAFARQVAIRRGTSTVFHHASNKAWVTTDQSGTQTVVGDTLFLAEKYNVSVTSSVDTIRYSARGFASLGSSQTYQLVRSGKTQTVCVSAAGLVLSRGCTL